MLHDFFEYGFMVRGAVAVLLSSICAGIAGSYIVSRRIVFLSGGITHASFGGIGLGHWAGFNPVAGAALFGVASGLAAGYLSGKRKMSEDSAIGIIWAFGMAAGIILIHMTPGYAPNLMSYLFGSILTVTRGDLIALAVMALLLVLYFSLFYRALVYMAFDEEYARTWSSSVDIFRYISIALISLTVVLNIRVAGVILVLSLFTIPPNVVMLFTNDYKRIVPASVAVSFTSVAAGYTLSFYLGIPTGATIIITLVVIYLVCRLIRAIINRLGERSVLSLNSKK